MFLRNEFPKIFLGPPKVDVNDILELFCDNLLSRKLTKPNRLRRTKIYNNNNIIIIYIILLLKYIKFIRQYSVNSSSLS